MARAGELARAVAAGHAMVELELPALQDAAASAADGEGYAVTDRRGFELRLGGDPTAALLRLRPGDQFLQAASPAILPDRRPFLE